MKPELRLKRRRYKRAPSGLMTHSVRQRHGDATLEKLSEQRNTGSEAQKEYKSSLKTDDSTGNKRFWLDASDVVSPDCPHNPNEQTWKQKEEPNDYRKTVMVVVARNKGQTSSVAHLATTVHSY